MPSSPLPENPSLAELEDQASFVQQLVQSGDEGALSMIDEFHPRLDSADLDQAQRAIFKKFDAQLIVAGMYRFSTWTELREHLKVVDEFSFTPAAEREGHDAEDESFVSLACLNYGESGAASVDRIERAHWMLEADPAVATSSIAALVAVGDHRSLAGTLDLAPSAVNERCGPNGWPPLLYATYSRIITVNSAWSAVETVKLLLDHGADPNAGFLWRGLVPPFTALTGAFGGGEGAQPPHPDRLVLARLLLGAGADPNDGQTLYNNGIGGRNHDDPSHLELLLEFGLGTQQNGPWYQRLGAQLRDPEESLYDELEAAALRGRPKILELLIGLGLDLNRPVGRSQKTPVRLAAEKGHGEVLRLLAEAGIDTALLPAEDFLHAIRTSDDRQLAALIGDHPGLSDTLLVEHPGAIKTVTADGTVVLAKLLDLGFDIHARTGGSGSTALHDAAQANDVSLARVLVEQGADPNLADAYIGATPWGWANHFGQAETAAYLDPLTQREASVEVTIRTVEGSATVASLADLDAVLDAFEAAATEPLLAHLESSGAHLSIGLGHTSASVALYLDTDGRPWHAIGPTIPDVDRELAFAGEKGRFEFDPEAAVSPATARRLAQDFARAPTERPAGVQWRVEGGE